MDPQSVLSAVIVSVKYYFSSFQKCIVIICIIFSDFLKLYFLCLRKIEQSKYRNIFLHPVESFNYAVKYDGVLPRTPSETKIRNLNS